MRAAIRALAYHLPEHELTNETLEQESPGLPAAKIAEKTGILTRHIAAPDECASDLAVRAAQKLFASGACTPDDVDYLLFCTQCPDYFLPTTACLIQERLGLPMTCGALDFNLGCSGFVYGLSLAKGLIESGQARNVLLLTGDTYSKFINPHDRSVRTLFGDAASATLIQGVKSDADQTGETGHTAPLDVFSDVPAEEMFIGPFVMGTDGRGGKNLIVPAGGLRKRGDANAPLEEDAGGNRRSANNLYMNGPEIFNFTLRAIPACINDLLARSGRALDDVDLFVFHQANKFMLDHLRKKADIPPDKFYIYMEQCGNTVSSTIPIALAEAERAGKLKPGMRVMIVGFGVGYSWGGAMLRWA